MSEERGLRSAPAIIPQGKINRNAVANAEAWKNMTPCERLTGKTAEQLKAESDAAVLATYKRLGIEPPERKAA